MVKIRKVCPFCGCDQITINNGFVLDIVYTTCDQCAASGPAVEKRDLMDGFIEAASDDEIEEALKELAVMRWNSRFHGPSDDIEALHELERMHVNE